MRPDLFIPVAERSSLIEDITLWTLNTALRELERMPGSARLERVSVNLSVRMLNDRMLADEIRSLLDIWGIEPRRLMLEITETSLIEQLDSAIETLQALKAQGLRLSIDDFGTGYSSMTYLRSLPADEMKIDRSFVAHMVENRMDEHIVKSLIHMAQDLGKQVVAEGVEDAATELKLAELGCDLIQGYHLARPMPMDELIAWLQDRPSG